MSLAVHATRLALLKAMHVSGGARRKFSANVFSFATLIYYI